MSKRAAHFTREKGDKKRNARPGNKNTAKGPRVGRREATPPPAAHSGGHRRRRKRPKTGGRDFARGANSHNGQVFQRGPDLIPRGNATLMLRVVYHDFRERIYRRLGQLVDTPRGALAFMQELADRTEGRPVKKAETSGQHFGAVFVFTTPDGRQVPASPPRQLVGQGVPPEAVQTLDPVDALILGLGHGDGAGKT